MNLFNQMMNGKSNAEKWDTLLNAANSKGIDINEKRITEEQLRKLGFKR